MDKSELDRISNKIIGNAIKVHRALGPGFVEKIYSRAIAHELEKEDIKFSKEKVIKVKYDGLLVGEQRLDILVEDEIIVEIKAVYEINNFHMSQTLSYLKAADKRLGLILNFARPRLQIRRVVNNF